MLRYKSETRPGLVVLYDIRPGNGAGPFLQPRSPHEAIVTIGLSHTVSDINGDVHQKSPIFSTPVYLYPPL